MATRRVGPLGIEEGVGLGGQLPLPGHDLAHGGGHGGGDHLGVGRSGGRFPSGADGRSLGGALTGALGVHSLLR